MSNHIALRAGVNEWAPVVHIAMCQVTCTRGGIEMRNGKAVVVDVCVARAVVSVVVRVVVVLQLRAGALQARRRGNAQRRRRKWPCMPHVAVQATRHGGVQRKSARDLA